MRRLRLRKRRERIDRLALRHSRHYWLEVAVETTITGRNLGVTDRFREYASEKSEKIAHLAERAIAFEVKVSRHHETRGSANGNDRVELTLVGPGPLVRAESDGSDKYVAFDLAMAKLVERIRQAKDKSKVHRGNHRPASLRGTPQDDFRVLDIVPADAATIDRVTTGAIDVLDVPTDAASLAETDEDYCPVVIRKKVFASLPMSVDEALYYMELVGHDFYLFIDSDNDRPSVVYRRKGWDYGVIGLDGNAAELQEVVTAGRVMR
jgi:ribosomal subunit interface protein